MFGSFGYENASIVQDGLLMHLDFGSNSEIYPSPVPTNSTYFDLSGNSNNAKISSGSMAYTGSIGYVDFNSALPSGSQIQPSQRINWYNQLVTGSGWTMQAWVNWDQITGTPEPCLVSQGNNTNNNGLHIVARTNKLVFAFYNSDLTSVSNLTVDKWQMFTFVYYAISPWRKEIWFDNRLDNSGTGNQYLGAPGAGGPQNFTIGFINWVNQKGFPMNGKIANFLFYKRPLTASDINQNYQATKNRFGYYQ